MKSFRCACPVHGTLNILKVMLSVEQRSTIRSRAQRTGHGSVRAATIAPPGSDDGQAGDGMAGAPATELPGLATSTAWLPKMNMFHRLVLRFLVGGGIPTRTVGDCVSLVSRNGTRR